MGNLPAGWLASYKVALANLAVSVGATGTTAADIVVLQMTAGSVHVETAAAFYTTQVRGGCGFHQCT
jgi:hypothetical protein